MSALQAPGPVPAGFEPVVRGGPYFEGLGTVYARESMLGLLIGPAHVNDYGIAHGGMLVTLADGALNRALQAARGAHERIVTAHLSVDFLAAARLGDWLEAHVLISRQGRTLGFAECRLCVGSTEIAHASGVFAVSPGGA